MAGPHSFMAHVTAVTAVCGCRARVPVTVKGAVACGGVNGVRGRPGEAAAARGVVARAPLRRRMRVPWMGM